jgi:holo-[acyl-carrier protein] synthase
MIVSIGTDVVHLPQIAGVIERRGNRFLERILTDGERAYCEKKRAAQRMTESVAARFAAKEAVMKALGTGWTCGVSWLGIEVVRAPTGAPGIRLHGRTAEVAAERGIARLLLSLTHAGDYAIAHVVALSSAAD